jgi:hypothetical protein
MAGFMSKARGVLILAAGMALGIPVTMVVNGDIELPWSNEALRSRASGPRPAATGTANPLTFHSPVALTSPEPKSDAPVVSLPSISPGSLPAWTVKPTPAERISLARELQKELSRAGCYGGSIDGVWTPASQKAMKGFMDRVNAQLPFEEPDQVLLALARSRQGAVCPKACRPPADNSCVEETAAGRTPVTPKPAPDGRLIQGGPANPQAAADPAAPAQPAQPRKRAAQKPSQGGDIFKAIFGF